MKFFVTLLIALSIFSAADAAKVDVYRNAVQNKTFTLRYRITEFPIRISNREANVNVSSWSPSIAARGHFNDNSINTGGIVVFDGRNSYIEIFHDAYETTFVRKMNGEETHSAQKIKEGGICFLMKDGEFFNFFWEMDDGVKNYYGSKSFFGGKSSKVKASNEGKYQNQMDKFSPYTVISIEYDFANADLAAALAAVLPADRIIATPTTPVYKFVGSGTLDGGLSYEDFSAEKNNTFYALRYYFSGDKMVKIAMFNYTKSGGAITGYEKHVLDIEEFSTAPDANYLQLPAGLKDATKRKDGGKK